MLEPHQPLQFCSYIVRTVADSSIVRNTLLAVLDTDAGPALIGEGIIMTLWAQIVQIEKVRCLLSTSSSFMVVKKSISLQIQIGNLHKRMGFLVVSSLETNTPLCTASISLYIKNIFAEKKTMSLVSSTTVGIVEARKDCLAVTTKNKGNQEPAKHVILEKPCVIDRDFSLP